MIIDFINGSGNREIIINPTGFKADESLKGPVIEIDDGEIWSSTAFETCEERDEAMNYISYHLKIGTKYLELK